MTDKAPGELHDKIDALADKIGLMAVHSKYTALLFAALLIGAMIAGKYLLP